MPTEITVPPPTPDVRLGGRTSTYNRDDVISQLEAFYDFLPQIPTEYVHKAPAGGWPSITAELLQIPDKTPEVVELLRRLPYLGGGVRAPCPWIAPEAFPCDYRLIGTITEPREKPGWFFNVQNDAGFARPSGEDADKPPGTVPFREEKWPPWVVQLTTGTDREGKCYMLDTSDGTVTCYCVTQFQYEPTYASDDPRAWRDRMCDSETVTLKELLDQWRDEYRKGRYLGLPDVDRGDYVSLFHWCESDGPESYQWQETKELRRIYRDHGWPNDYDKDGCHRALKSWYRAY